MAGGVTPHSSATARTVRRSSDDRATTRSAASTTSVMEMGCGCVPPRLRGIVVPSGWRRVSPLCHSKWDLGKEALVDAEVIVVGGGIAGCALAVRLADAGVAVTVLERERVYRDIVRGEALVPWGFQEAVQLGVADVILETEGVSVMTRMVPYDESLTVEQAQRRSRDLSDVVDGAPGVVGVGHPELREALATAATKAGATVIRGVRRAVVRGGTNPTVTYDVDGCTH